MSQVFEDLARSALAEIAEDSEVGEFLGIDVLESAHVARFAMAHPGYVGWHWSVAISGEPAGIDELWLEPGEGALVAKPWTPWSERIQPGDLAPGDVFPTPADDSRLIPGFSGSDVAEELDEPLRPLQWELGLGRSRVLSSEGVDEAV
jgi:hypothetical protein